MSLQAITHACGTRHYIYPICNGIVSIPFAMALYISREHTTCHRKQSLMHMGHDFTCMPFALASRTSHVQSHYIYPICNGTIHIEGAYYMSSQAITHAHGTRLYKYAICTSIMYIPCAITLHVSHLQWHYTYRGSILHFTTHAQRDMTHSFVLQRRNVT